ncbi:MAG: hypothetical protein ABJD68_13265, partial [Nakamurella sp.]
MCTEGAPSLVGALPWKRLCQWPAVAVGVALMLAPRTYNVLAVRAATPGAPATTMNRDLAIAKAG